MKALNSRRGLVGLVLAAALLSVAGSALAAGSKAPRRAKLAIKGGESIKPNAYFKNTFHFEAGRVTIRSGGTVTLTNKTADGHTLSIVTHAQLPHTLKQLENCAVCKTIATSHGITEGPPAPGGPPPIPVVNVGAAGFNTPGDSVIIAPRGHGAPVAFKVTARPGTVLYFMCAIHPWMQGRFVVK
jgi:plastocyanin